LPSSLTRVLPSPLVSSTCPPVSVCGTGAGRLARGFSRHPGSLPLAGDVSPARTPASACVRGFAAGPPARLDASLRRDNLGASPPRSSRLHGGAGILTGCPSPTRRRLGLGPPHPEGISLALESLGIRGAGFAPASRYSYRHSPLPPLHRISRSGFTADGNAPLPCRVLRTAYCVLSIRGVGTALEPPWIVRAATPSTSELLRTHSRVAASKPTSWLSARRDNVSHLARISGP
jgi:hypothetical protein